MTEPRRQIRALFVGNSFTLRHDPPGVLSRMCAARANGPLLAATSLAVEGAALHSHLAGGGLKRMLERQLFDFVILQDRSAGPLNEPAAFLDVVRRCDEIVQSGGARTVLFSTWLGRDQRGWEDVASVYDRAGAALGAPVAHVGRAWREAADRGLELYDADGKHAGELGAYLTACVFHHILLGANPDAGGNSERELLRSIAAGLQK